MENTSDNAVSKKKRQGVKDTEREYLEGAEGYLYRRGGMWWVEYWRDGERHRESTKSPKRQAAVTLLKQRNSEIARKEFVGTKEDKILVETLLDAVVLDYENRGNRSADTLTFRLAPLRGYFRDRKAVKVTTLDIERFKEHQLKEGGPEKKGVAKATVNRSLAALRRAYTLAVKHKTIAPTRVPGIELFPEDNARTGFLGFEDYQALLTHMASPVDGITRFGYHSGWRRGEIISLLWSDVDQEHGVVRLRSEVSKSKEPRELPITGTIKEVLERRWSARLVADRSGNPRVCDYVFHRDGEPVLDFRGAWDKAVTAIGRPTLLFHDLRRSAVRNMIQAGVSEKVAMGVTGHKTRSVFDRYHIVTTKDLQSALERTEASLRADRHKMAIYRHNDQETEARAESQNGTQDAN